MEISIVFVLSALLLTTATPESPASTSSCSDDLVLFSTCLPFISSFPNNVTNSPSRRCCDEIASAMESGGAICLCYLIQEPRILGFSVNSTRVVSLPTVCRMRNGEVIANTSLKHLCSGNITLPPLKSITGPGISTPHLPGGEDSAPPPPVSLPPKPDNKTSGLPRANDSSIPPADDIEFPAITTTHTPPAVAVESPTNMTVTPTRSASTVVTICFSCRYNSLGIPLLLVNMFI
ncbi:unnamed protein product [Cuscuta epithymum]|uniref:Bifunctional inhibitor/plant lipid transfer protein/seed storage helical domain-containing protein n=1 Tax=Cuscuta epithymum TaxID=186058 RepID=A0AAV0CVE7_9ASTE|nr:unnamed protein product [Cuscuta epithymum]